MKPNYERKRLVYEALAANPAASSYDIVRTSGLSRHIVDEYLTRLVLDGVISSVRVGNKRVFTILRALPSEDAESVCGVCRRTIETHPRCAACGILVGPGHEETRLVGPFDPDCLQMVAWRLKHKAPISVHTMTALCEWLDREPLQLPVFDERRAA